MRNTKRDVTTMTVAELQREKLLRQAWIRDVSGLNRTRMQQIEKELEGRKAEAETA